MVSAGPPFSVLLQGLLVLGQVVLLQVELVLSGVDGWDVCHHCALESLVRSEVRLEIQPILLD